MPIAALRSTRPSRRRRNSPTIPPSAASGRRQSRGPASRRPDRHAHRRRQSRRQRRPAPRRHRRQRGDARLAAAAARSRRRTGSTAAPTPAATLAEQRRSRSRPASRSAVDRGRRPLRREFALLARRRVVRVRPAVLQHARLCGRRRSAVGKRGFDSRRDHRQRQRCRCRPAPAGGRGPASSRPRRRPATTGWRPARLPPTDRAHPPDRAIRRLPGAGVRPDAHHAIIPLPLRDASPSRRPPRAIAAMIWAERRAPLGIDRELGRGRAAARSIAAPSARRRQLVLAHQLAAPRAARCSARISCSVSRLGGKRHQHRPRLCGDDVERGVVAALADRNMAAPQQRREIAPEPLDRDAVRRLAAEPAKSASVRFVPVSIRHGCRCQAAAPPRVPAPPASAPPRPRRRRPRPGPRPAARPRVRPLPGPLAT